MERLSEKHPAIEVKLPESLLVADSCSLSFVCVLRFPIQHHIASSALDRSQPLFYFAPQDSHSQAGSTSFALSLSRISTVYPV